ncbi:hypothetical protein QR680_012402 [Steinernema hermaphroditum]|uniref:Uncharacterized protein n=1 Tax=Steinernema hermaphroditum TaxID=289476 RepID=A0AA39I3V5_9BILA|nr:hypothetical protein QR680_012402 [Steinernema hermaphroditum]
MGWKGLVLLLLAVSHVAAREQTYGAVKEQTYETKWECHVNDPLSCDQTKSEVCTFRDGSYVCDCPPGVQKLPDGRCLLINECLQPRLNDCHENAKCIDKSEGYTCECKPGFADISEHPDTKPGRICTSKLNECLEPYKNDVDCSPNADCVDTPDWFTCKCRVGFTDISATLSKLPGRKCVQMVNECVSGQSDCSANADCVDEPEGFLCKCRAGFVDVSRNVTHFPGRQCALPREPEYYGGTYETKKPQCDLYSNSCGPNEQCRRNARGEHTCQCIEGATQTRDGVCRVFNQCEHLNECDRNAVCSNAFDSYKCQCKPGYKDVSPDPLRLPGRKCQILVNECADRTHTCSPYARCEDTQEGYLCHCNGGFTDVSSRYGLQPGRKCAQANNYCGDRDLNSCDENADCVPLPDGYTCKCFVGYADVSSNANLPSGRVCTLQTTCPAQPTDLVFVIDGSGSIGSLIFQSDVLRFVSEFVELFDVGPDRTRVGVVQYSDRIRHEFDLNEFSDLASLKKAIGSIEYLTGLTRTGAAIEHVVGEAFSERRGSRPVQDGVARVAIVITDGRSQDNVTVPANNARAQRIQLFAVGVTSHVLDEELEAISGSRAHTFHVSGFKDLNTRLRSAIQKVTCPQQPPTPSRPGPCDTRSHQGCDRSRNQICTLIDGKPACSCPVGFDPHPLTQECGGEVCDPKIVSSCPHPEICQITPFGNHRCACPNGERRHPKTGACKSTVPPTSTSEDECGPNRPCGGNEECLRGPYGTFVCQCKTGFVRNPGSEKCQLPGQCDPSIPESCDLRRKEQCLPDLRSPGTYTCQCPPAFARHPVTQMCLINECVTGQHECSPDALCTDTDESYICSCKFGFVDESPDPTRKPGRVCRQQVDECLANTHNCSVNAVCFNLPDGFLCRCKPEFVDFSPNPQQFGGVDCRALVDECANPSLNNCHPNARCIDTRDGYTCQCKEGFLDQDELRNPGRDCRKVNRLCAEGKHDCDRNARCIERGATDFECVCNAGFLDKSSDPRRPGRRCLEGVCSDKTKNDCHPAAICSETADGFTCKCRDGYVEQNPLRPGRQCKELVNECLDSTLNDCDPLATCLDREDGYTCVCPIGTKDVSPDTATRPGRKCFALVNECRNPHLNNCSRFADCLDKEEGYECRCKADYHDNDPAHPGTDCKFIIDECQSPNLNDCHKHAKCLDTREGYTCECLAPYRDVLPSKPGRDCRYNECEDPKVNDCDQHADCVDTDDGFFCQCKAGFYDTATDPKKAGRECIALITQRPVEAEPTTANPNLIPCGGGHCHLDRGEVCIGSERCGCRPNQGRELDSDACVDVDKTPIEIRVVGRGPDSLTYSSEYGAPNKPAYVEIVDAFVKGMKGAVGKTTSAPRYVTTEVDYITNPKVENPDWDKGLLFNGSVLSKGPLDKCRFWQELVDSIKSTDQKLGDSVLVVADDVNELDPCKPEPQKGTPCGSGFCNPELGEQCIAGRLCGCPNGQKRASADEKCRQVEAFNMPIYVIREGSTPIKYVPSFANPQDDTTKKYSKAFEKGVGDSYGETPLKKSFVAVEVNDIASPDSVNKTWGDRGLLYNFTSYFTKGGVAEPEKVFTDLIDFIKGPNRFEVGHSNLFINPEQPNPFSVCYKTDCHPNATCTPTRGGYTCACPKDFRDLDVEHPGRKCLAIAELNECERPEDNECAPEARCIDLPYLYRCECEAPFVNAAEKDKLPGSVCRYDYCKDVNFCPANTTCNNEAEQAFCACRPGFVDIRKSPNRHLFGLADSFCLRATDIDECALGLHNCSAAAVCQNLRVGYTCACQEGYTDGNPAEPGRVCAALLCGQCNGHGHCIGDAGSANVTCSCVEGYTGDFCEVAPSSAGLILLIILALLFLLLTLLCCLYACCRTHCFGWGRRGLAESTVTPSDYVATTIPRPTIIPPFQSGLKGDGGHENLAAWDSASLSSGSTVEEIERRITTDVTTREIRTTTVDGAVAGHEEHSASFTVHPPIEMEAEQYATMSSDHFRHDVVGASSLHGASAFGAGEGVYGQRSESAYGQRGAGAMATASAHHYDLDSESVSGESDAGGATFDRRTRVNRHHEYFPSANGAVERQRNEYVTTTTAKETNYF